jgi:hypothetical membrane protein
MKRLTGLAMIAVLISGAVQPRHAEARGPSTPEERARFVARVHSLESDPLGENSNATRQQLRQWMTDVPDIRFKVCPDLLASALSNGYPYSRAIDLQVALSGATLTLEHPGEARDDVAVYTAGVQGALRAYEVLLQSRPDAHLAELDELVKKRDRGELRDHLARLAKERCKKSNRLLIAAPIGAAVGVVLGLLVGWWFGGSADTAPMRVAPIFRRIVLGCVAYYLIAGTALHFLEPEYDPRFHFMSDYAWGAYGLLMTTTFFVLALAILAVALGLRKAHQSSQSARLGFGLLVVGALFVCVAGVFRGFPLHDVGSGVGLPTLVMAALLVSWSFRTAPEWQAIHSAAALISVGMLAALVSIIVDVGMPGLQQRAFLLLLLAWLSIVAHRLVRTT